MSEYNNGELLKPIHNPVNPTDLICPIDRSVINCSIEYDYSDFNCEDLDPSFVQASWAFNQAKIMVGENI